MLFSAQSANALFMPKATPKLHSPLVHAAPLPFRAAMLSQRLPDGGERPAAGPKGYKERRKHETGWELFTLGVLTTVFSTIWLRKLNAETVVTGPDKGSDLLKNITIGFIVAGAACTVVGLSIALSHH